jgi:hypothetical protein
MTHLWIFNFTVVWKWYALSSTYFWILILPWVAGYCMISLSGKCTKPELPVSHAIVGGNKQHSTVHCVGKLGCSIHFWLMLFSVDNEFVRTQPHRKLSCICKCEISYMINARRGKYGCWTACMWRGFDQSYGIRKGFPEEVLRSEVWEGKDILGREGDLALGVVG